MSRRLTAGLLVALFGQPALAAPFQASGDWQYNATGADTPAIGDPKTASTHISCTDGKFRASIANYVLWVGKIPATTEVSFDDGASFHEVNPMSLPAWVVKEMTTASEMRVRWVTSSREVILDAFSLKGSSRAIGTVMTTCGVKFESGDMDRDKPATTRFGDWDYIVVSASSRHATTLGRGESGASLWMVCENGQAHVGITRMVIAGMVVRADFAIDHGPFEPLKDGEVMSLSMLPKITNGSIAYARWNLGKEGSVDSFSLNGAREALAPVAAACGVAM